MPTFTRTKTFSPRPTRTPTNTFTRTATPTSSPTGCPTLTITGLVYNANGSPAVNARFTIEVVREQIVGGCVIHVSHTTVRTDSSGALPPTATGVGGTAVHLSVENGGAYAVTLPRFVSSVAFATLIGPVTPTPLRSPTPPH